MSDPARPAYVQFEIRPVEDREKSIEAGHHVSRDVVFAIITPAGTKDRIEKVADDWLESVREGVKQERIPGEWLTAYERSYENFKNSREDPEDGTSVREWPALSPSQVRLLLDINIRTVEDLAAANEETVQRIGMGGRALKHKAQAWVDTSNGKGKIAAELEQLRQRNSELEARDKTRDEEFKALTARLDALEKKPEPVKG